LLTLLVAGEKVAAGFSDLILWFVHSGMRRSEVLSLKWADIRTVDERRIYAQVRRSKSDVSRSIPLTRTMMEIVSRQRIRTGGSDRVFPVGLMTLRRYWERSRESSGLSDVTLHDLRRTHATYAVANGVDLRTLADRLGHGSLAMLQRHYAAVVGTAAMEATTRIQGAFDQLIPDERHPA
jgi:integrase